MNLKIAMCEALVDGWNANWDMNRVIAQAWILCGKTPVDNIKKYTDIATAINVKHIHGETSAKVWIARNIPKLNESLWAGRKRDTCISCAKIALGIRRKTGSLQISVREIDKRHDWNTVK